MTGGGKSRKALGKGLSALLPNRSSSTPPPAETPLQKVADPTSVHIDLIAANPSQPRTHFRQDRLEELAQSIRANGVIQPLIVRRVGTRFELVAGERRWRAAKLAGLAAVPVLVQDFAEDRLLELALIENIQREDLNPIETAHAFDRLVRDLGLSHEEIGRRTGKDRSSIANSIRLLKLPAEVQNLVGEGQLPMGHARALLALPDPKDQISIAQKAAAQSMSTRQVEALVRQITEPKLAKAEESAKLAEDPNVKAAVVELERALGTRVRILPTNATRGRIEIDYYSPDELHRIYSLIAG